MQIQTNSDAGANFIRRLKFPSAIEQEFQTYYFERVRLPSVGLLLLLLGTALLFALMELSYGASWLFCGAPFLVLVLAGLAFRRDFALHWQPLVMAATLVPLGFTLLSNSKSAIAFTSFFVLITVCGSQRFQVRWLLLQTLFVILMGSTALIARLPLATEKLTEIDFAFLLLMVIPVLLTLKHERFQRSEFWSKFSLSQERNEERQKREQTERMLHVLSQAIGGIVHDLGNPLTAVQSGAETLLLFVKDGEPDREVVQEFAEIITDGAQMLNYLRLSLMEQTRVLEGKPVPVSPTITGVHHIVKAGAHYQKPKFASGRKVSIDGEDLQIHVDEMRFITIFMNLIGNALKYSDGEVRICWRVHEARILIAVLDQGRAAQGISQSQAQELFVPFGRLDTHAQVEGTGLGLLSVRKIAEAHGGEVYIEGTADGTPQTANFNTALGTYPTLLEPEFRTAFVTACPINRAADNGAATANEVQIASAVGG